jgi:hypothetical protein
VAEVAGAESAIHFAECEANSVAIPERRRCVNLQVGRGEVGGFQTGAELFCFEGKLRGVSDVLELASSTEAEVRTKRSCVFLRWDVGEVE